MLKQKTATITIQSAIFAMDNQGKHIAMAGVYKTSSGTASFLYGIDNPVCHVNFAFDFNNAFSN